MVRNRRDASDAALCVSLRCASTSFRSSANAEGSILSSFYAGTLSLAHLVVHFGHFDLYVGCVLRYELLSVYRSILSDLRDE